MTFVSVCIRVSFISKNILSPTYTSAVFWPQILQLDLLYFVSSLWTLSVLVLRKFTYFLIPFLNLLSSDMGAPENLLLKESSCETCMGLSLPEELMQHVGEMLTYFTYTEHMIFSSVYIML